MAGKAIDAALLAVQQGLKAPKDKSGGKYSYRSAEDILEKVKPLLQENGLILLLDEAIKADAVGSFIESTATLVDIATGDSVSTHSMAREDVGTKFMSPGQATGAAVSYARKYALGGMFAIDNEQDIDSQEYQQKRSQTAQNRPQQPAKQNAGTYKGGGDEIRHKAIEGLKAEVGRIGCTWDEVTAIANYKMGKAPKEMTAGNIAILTNNLETWLMGTEKKKSSKVLFNSQAADDSQQRG
jgi:hypothetical protein